MRRLALLLSAGLAVLVLHASPASADHSSDPIVTGAGATVHWKQSTEGATVHRNGRLVPSLERTIHVIVPAEYASDGGFMHAMNHAVNEGDRSPYINMVLDVPAVAPTSCPSTHCILVSRAPMNGAITSFGWDAQGHMFGLAARVGFDSGPWETNSLLNAACHEIAGHGLGLAHSSHGNQGPCVGTLTDHDLNLINTAHSHKDSQPWGSGSATTALKTKVHTHSHAFYENLGN